MTVYTVDKLQELVRRAEESEHTGANLFNSVHRLAQIYQAWQAANDPQANTTWLANLQDESGQSLFSPTEVPQFAKALDQIFTALDEIGENYTGNIKQSGGKFPEGTPVRGPDDVVQMIMDRIGAVDEMSRSYAREYGVLKMLNDSDQGKTKNFKTPVIPQIGLVTPLPVSPRLVIVFAYSLVEIIRILVSGTIPGLRSDLLRRVLSLVLGTTDLLFGRWKQAILSYAGILGSSTLYITLIMKMALDVFYLLSPEIRKEVIFTTMDSFKSLIIGLIIASFQTFAPQEVRQRVNDSLKSFNDSIGNINERLVGAGLKPLPADIFFTFGDLNNLQVLVRKPEIICSQEMESVIEIFNKDAPSLGFALQLLGYPMDVGRRGEICRSAGYELGQSTLMELFVADSKRRTEADARAKLNEIARESPAESQSALLAQPPAAEPSQESPSTPSTESLAQPPEPEAVPAQLSDDETLQLPQPSDLLPPALQQAREQTSDIPLEIPRSIRSVGPKVAPFGKLSSLRAKKPL